jgi:mercuric ion binding protein
MNVLAKSCIAALLSLSMAFAASWQTVVVDLQNIQCYGCLLTVKRALEKVSGVEETKMDLEHKTATVKFDPSKTNPDELIKATEEAGFPSTVRK